MTNIKFKINPLPQRPTGIVFYFIVRIKMTILNQIASKQRA